MYIQNVCVIVATVVLLGLGESEASDSSEGLPIFMTPEEEQIRHLIGQGHRTTSPPQGPARNPAEFEPMTGVLIRYPFGLGGGLIGEMAEDVIVWVIVENAGEQSAVHSYLEGQGVDMEHVKYVFAPTNSIWTRDYGPWFVVDGAGQQGIVDHIYNRPRPYDDLIPSVVGDAWDIPAYGMDLVHTGGNYMSDGRGVAMSSRLVYDENPGLSPAQVDSIMKSYLGIKRYHALPYIEDSGIHHIDCWAKFLSPSKLLVKEVPFGHSDYERIESNVSFLQTIPNSYGRHYEIVRIPCPDGAPYTNSLILNDKVLVPTFGIFEDGQALSIYEAAMPGYQVLGFGGSWSYNDALHCRTMGITDRFMLYIDHVPLVDTDDVGEPYRVKALIVDGSGMGLKTDSLLVYWRTTEDTTFSPALMNQISLTDSFYLDLPPQPMGTEVSYYIFAADHSGRRERHPYVAPGCVHSFRVRLDVVPPEIVHTPLADISVGGWPPTASAQVTDSVEVAAVHLESWIDGVQQPDVEMFRVEGTFSYEGAFPGSVVVGDSARYRIVAMDVASPPNVASSPSEGYHSFTIVDQISVLIWDADPNRSSGPTMQALLDSLGVSCVYTVDLSSHLSQLSMYGSIFVCAGIATQNYVIAEGGDEALALEDYLQNGGNLYIEGGDVWFWDPGHENGHDFGPSFGIDALSDGAGDLVVVMGQTGSFAEGMTFSYAGENNYIDRLLPAGGSFAAFVNSSPSYVCAVARNAEIYRTVGCSFELGGLVDGQPPSAKAELLGAILGFFDIPLAVEEDDATREVPDKFSLFQNHPNPFNPATVIPYLIPAQVAGGSVRRAVPVSLKVYNIAGQVVRTLVDEPQGPGQYRVVWDGRDERGQEVASGVYLYRLRVEGYERARRMIVLR